MSRAYDFLKDYYLLTVGMDNPLLTVFFFQEIIQ